MEPKPTYAELMQRVRELEAGASAHKDGPVPPGPPQFTPETLTALYAISQTVNQSLHLEQILDAALDKIMELFKPHSVHIRLLDPKTQEMRLAAHKGLSSDQLAILPQRLKVEAAVSRHAIQSGRGIVIEDVLTDPRTAGKHSFAERIGCRTLVTFALYGKDQILGSMSIRSQKPKAFKADEIDLFAAIGYQVGTAIENATLFMQVREHTADLEVMNQQLQQEIEDRRRVQEELRQAKEAAEAASTAKSNFLANMSHELRTPLNHIIGFTELLVDQHYGELNEVQADYLADVLKSGQHLLALINEILDLSRVEAGKASLDLSDVMLGSLLADSLMMFKDKALEKRIQLATDIGDIPEIIQADARRLKQVLYNLLSNALKFTPDGGRVRLSARPHGGEGDAPSPGVEISVADTGIGLREEDLQTIFNPFEQVEATRSRKFEGTGLGLALTRRFVEMHGGTIWAESAGEGRGSTFRFVIPATGIQ